MKKKEIHRIVKTEGCMTFYTEVDGENINDLSGEVQMKLLDAMLLDTKMATMAECIEYFTDEEYKPLENTPEGLRKRVLDLVGRETIDGCIPDAVEVIDFIIQRIGECDADGESCDCCGDYIYTHTYDVEVKL